MGQFALGSGIRLFDAHASRPLARATRNGTVRDFQEAAKGDFVKVGTELETSDNVMGPQAEQTHPFLSVIFGPSMFNEPKQAEEIKRTENFAGQERRTRRTVLRRPR